MYFLSLFYQNARLNLTGQFSPHRTKTAITKWTLLDDSDKALELLRLIVASGNAPQHLEHIPFSFESMRGAETEPLIARHLRVLHVPTDSPYGKNVEVTGGVRFNVDGKIEKVPKACDGGFFQESILRNPMVKSKPGRDFMLAYGADFSVHRGDDCFDFGDPMFRTRRYHSIFSANALLTDPLAFLDSLFYRGSKYKRYMPYTVLHRICLLLETYLALDVRRWLTTPLTAEQEWSVLPETVRTPIALLLDAVRHTLDASPKIREPLNLPGVILLHQPNCYCGAGVFSAWLECMDALFPNMQFLMTIPKEMNSSIPKGLLKKELRLPLKSEKVLSHPISGDKVDVLLIDVDSRMPNLALMKLSRYFKQNGRSVTLSRGLKLPASVREIYASCIFASSPSAKKIQKLREFYGNSLQLGGSGIDPQQRLPEQIEVLQPDYALYPELAGRAIGFLSRGCPLHCPFCIVPLKEGLPRQVSDLQDLLENGRRNKLILLDDNLLSLPHADRLLEEMISRKIMVNFTQTLDLRFVDRNRAGLLRRIDCRNTRFTRSNYHFSLNNSRNLDHVREKYNLFGFASRDNAEFVCMYGFDTTLSEDLARFRFLRSLHGAYVFTQEYQPIPGGPPPDVKNFFDGDFDRMIAELIKIEFTQNMKSMEKYYRWMSKRYMETFGRLHMPLVDTIFRYNLRHQKGRYIATMAGLKK